MLGVLVLVLVLALAPAASVAQSDSYDAADWWQAGSGQTLSASADFNDPSGKTGLLNASGPVETRGHPFFEPIGSNGRACVTCHQPANAMSISVTAIRGRWEATHGKDPLFAAVDGSNCPSAPQEAESSHSLLLRHGLFRIFLPWPPKAADGSIVTAEFDLALVSDPTGCNSDPIYGLHSAQAIAAAHSAHTSALSAIQRCIPRRCSNSTLGYCPPRKPRKKIPAPNPYCTGVNPSSTFICSAAKLMLTRSSALSSMKPMVGSARRHMTLRLIATGVIATGRY
jgi:hypothetical protein